MNKPIFWMKYPYLDCDVRMVSNLTWNLCASFNVEESEMVIKKQVSGTVMPVEVMLRTWDIRVTYLDTSQRHRNVFSGSFVLDLTLFWLGAIIISFFISPVVWSGVLGHVLLAEVTFSRIYQHHLLGYFPKDFQRWGWEDACHSVKWGYCPATACFLHCLANCQESSLFLQPQPVAGSSAF